MYLKMLNLFLSTSALKRRGMGAGAGVATFLVACGLLAGPVVGQADEIKKCQDAEGNWHYGNFAAQSCAADADVDEIDETGTKTGVDKPPPSSEEIAKQEELAKAINQAKLDKKRQRKADLEVLRIYGTEQTIISTRDRKLAAIDKNIEVTRLIKGGTLKDIDKLNELKPTKNNLKLLKEREEAVKSYNRVIRHNLTEREKLSEKYITILSDFRGAYGRVYTK